MSALEKRDELRSAPTAQADDIPADGLFLQPERRIGRAEIKTGRTLQEDGDRASTAGDLLAATHHHQVEEPVSVEVCRHQMRPGRTQMERMDGALEGLLLRRKDRLLQDSGFMAVST